MLHILRLKGLLAIDKHHAINDFQAIARHANETLDIVLTFVDRMRDDLAEVLMVVPYPLSTVFSNKIIIVDTALEDVADRVASRVVEHDGVVTLHRRDTWIAVIRQLNPLYIRFFCLATRQGIVYKGERKRCVGSLGTIMYLADNQVIANAK